MYAIDTETKYEFLDRLGVPYVLVIGEGVKVLFLSEAEAKRQFDGAVEEGSITADEATPILAAIHAKGLLDWDVIRSRIVAYELDAREWPFNLRACGCGSPHPHGHIFHSFGIPALHEGQHTLYDIIGLFDSQVGAEDTIFVLKQAVEVDLAADHHEREVRYAALPAETRETFEALRG